jgi:hypothetical protein
MRPARVRDGFSLFLFNHSLKDKGLLLMTSAQLDVIKKFIESALADVSCNCKEVEWDTSDNTLRVYITRKDSRPVNIDDCVAVARLLNSSDDLDELVEGAYTLEVSSPGVSDVKIGVLEGFEVENNTSSEDISL